MVLYGRAEHGDYYICTICCERMVLHGHDIFNIYVKSVVQLEREIKYYVEPDEVLEFKINILFH